MGNLDIETLLTAYWWLGLILLALILSVRGTIPIWLGLHVPHSLGHDNNIGQFLIPQTIAPRDVIESAQPTHHALCSWRFS
jgi:hypothetical protein